jgi:dTDP-glucose 4,6-dehydratase
LASLLITGGLGFIGSNFIRYMLSTESDVRVVNLDKLSYGSNPANLKDIRGHSNYRFVKGDICDDRLVNELTARVDGVINFAAETHVDRSISNSRSFVDSNTLGTLTLLESCRGRDLKFLQISTDEVYGPSDGRAFKEEDALNPSSPYAASKASADMLVKAYHKTYGLEVLITRCTNNFGSFQFPEKFIPKAIIRGSQNLTIPIYGSGRQVRDWIHVVDHCEAIDQVRQHGRAGEIYNVAGGNQIANLQVAEQILDILGKPRTLITHVDDRPGHDERYRLDTAKIEDEMQWTPKRQFEDALKETVTWYSDNEDWWRPLADERTLSATPWKEKW